MGDINYKSLAARTMDEARFLGGGETAKSLFGEPISYMMYIWPIQINVTKDPEGNTNFQKAMAQVMNAAQQLCVCKAPPEEFGPQIPNPLQHPLSTAFPAGKTAADWREVIDRCK